MDLFSLGESQVIDTRPDIVKSSCDVLTLFTEELNKQTVKDGNYEPIYNTIANCAAKLLGMLPKPLPWTKFIDKLDFSSIENPSLEPNLETIFNDCLHQVSSIYKTISNAESINDKTSKLRSEIEQLNQIKDDHMSLLQGMKSNDSFSKSKVLKAALEEIKEKEEEINNISLDVKRITDQFTVLGNQVLQAVQSQLKWRFQQTQKQVEKLDETHYQNILKEVGTNVEEFFEINDYLKQVPQVCEVVRVKCFSSLMVCQAEVEGNCFLYVYELKDTLTTWIKKKTEKKFQGLKITAYTCFVQEEEKKIYLALNNRSLLIYDNLDIANDPNKVIDLKVVCTDILSFGTLLLLALETNNIIVVNLENFKFKQSQISNPVQKLHLVSNFAIASEKVDAKRSCLRRIRPIEQSSKIFFQEKSRINCCDVFLEWNSQTNQCFGFDTNQQRFVQFQLQALKPFDNQEDEFQIQINIRYFDFKQSFNFNRIYYAEDQDNKLDPKKHQKQCPTEIYFQAGIQNNQAKVFILDLNTRLVNDDQKKSSTVSIPKIEEDPENRNNAVNSFFKFEKNITEKSYQEKFTYQNENNEIVTVQCCRKNEEVIRMQLMNIDQDQQEQIGQTEGINERNLTQSKLCLSQKEDYLFFIDQNKNLYVCDTNKMPKMQWNAENDRKKDLLPEKVKPKNEESEENKVQNQKEQVVQIFKDFRPQKEQKQALLERLEAQKKEQNEQVLRMTQQKKQEQEKRAQEEKEIEQKKWFEKRMQIFEARVANQQAITSVANQLQFVPNDLKPSAKIMDISVGIDQVDIEYPSLDLKEMFLQKIDGNVNKQKQIQQAPLVSEQNEEEKQNNDWNKIELENKKKNKKKRR